MRRPLLYDYNLQFFADDPSDPGEPGEPGGGGEGGDGGSGGAGGIDPEAFAAILAEKDKKLDELEKEMKQLKKSNAELLVKISAGAKAGTEKTFEENLLEMVGAKPRKE